MDSSLLKKSKNKAKRTFRTRRHIKGTTERPRLSVVKTNAHIHIQLIDDEKHVTLASASTVSKENRGKELGKKNKETGKQLGLNIAKLAIGKNVKKVVFDRGSFKYHGVIAAVADGAREGGLEL